MRQDVIGWFCGMVFIAAWLGAMWGWGIAKDWNALSGYYYEDVNNTMERFLPEPFGCNDTSTPGRYGHAECTSTWYFWKLPPSDVTALTSAMVWLFYCLHQIFVWALIYRAQLMNSSKKTGQPKYQTSLRWFNWSLLLVNALFHVLHLVQSHWTYDGLAQDLSTSSSQSSVIMMICFILLMEYKDRGFMLMWPNPKSDDKVAKYLRLHQGPVQLIRKYHGYAFAWATIYTFWFHPTENTWAHTTGFFHTAIVMLQGSLIYTDMHQNKYWRLLNEAWVLAHGTIVALQTSNPAENAKSSWPIFTFGFGFVFAFTQVYSFPFWKKVSAFFRIIPVLIFLVLVCALCGTVLHNEVPGESGFSRFYEMFFIPAEEYLMFFVSWLFLYGFIKIEAKFLGDRKLSEHTEVSATKQAAVISVSVLIYALFIVGAHLCKHLPASFFVMMVVYVFIFCLGVSITIILLKQVMGPFRKMIRSSLSRTEPKVNEKENVGSIRSVTKSFDVGSV